MSVFSIVPDFAGRAHIVCEACQSQERYWDANQAARWKAAHTQNCPGHRPRLEGDES